MGYPCPYCFLSLFLLMCFFGALCSSSSPGPSHDGRFRALRLRALARERQQGREAKMGLGFRVPKSIV